MINRDMKNQPFLGFLESKDIVAQKGLPRPVSHANNGQVQGFWFQGFWVSGFLGFRVSGFKLRRSAFDGRRSTFNAQMVGCPRNRGTDIPVRGTGWKTRAPFAAHNAARSSRRLTLPVLRKPSDRMSRLAAKGHLLSRLATCDSRRWR